MKKQGQESLQHHILQEYVAEERSTMPRLGGRKLYHKLKGQFEAHSIAMGRDKFFAWLGSQDLLVKPKKRFTKTTHSHHRFRIYTNLVREKSIQSPDQVWVSDITYLRLQKGFCYLALITDAYSRKIVGYDVNATLELEGCLSALKMACKGRIKKQGTIHHSDRGIQYCSSRYTEMMKKNGIQISMAQAGNCYENAMAERVNGILKGEFNLDHTFADLAMAQKAVVQAITTYNTKRPHLALNMRLPAELYVA